MLRFGNGNTAYPVAFRIGAYVDKLDARIALQQRICLLGRHGARIGKAAFLSTLTGGRKYFISHHQVSFMGFWIIVSSYSDSALSPK
jgi:hypothetical protein